MMGCVTRFAASTLFVAVAGCANPVPEPAPRATFASPRASLVNFRLPGKIAKVEDGDTLTMHAQGGGSFVIRLSDIDTPEVFLSRNPSRDRCPAGPADAPGQQFGKAATASLMSMAPAGAAAVAECYEIDAYSRLVCHVFVGNTNLSLEQIRQGWAMTLSNPRWVRDPDSAREEANARQRKAGIWSVANPASPEKWRKECWCDGACRDAEKR